MSDLILIYLAFGVLTVGLWRAWLSSEPYVQLRIRLDREVQRRKGEHE